MLPSIPGFQRKRSKALAYYPTDRERRLMGELYARYKPNQRESGKQPFEWKWFRSVAFYEGQQHVYWNGTTQRLESKSPPKHRRRYTANWILPAVQRATSRVLDHEPGITVVPATEDSEDRHRAEVAEQVWKSYWNSSDMERKVSHACTLACVTGMAFFHPRWDPSKGKVVGGTGQQKFQRQGDVAIDVFSPFEIFVDSNATSIDNAEWAARSRIKPLEAIRRQYPKHGKYVEAEQDADQHSWYQRRLRTLSGTGGYASLAESSEDQPRATVVDFWMRPNEDYPRGLHLIVANGVLLNPQNIDNPYVGLDDQGFMEIPFFEFGWTEAVERFWQIGMVEQLVPVQREINAKKSQMIENVNFCSRPKWLAPKGSGIPKGSFTSEPGEVIFYNPAFPPPAPMPISPLPDYAWRQLDDLKEDFARISSQNDLSQGNVPAGLRTGVALQALSERDNGVYSDIRKRLYRALGRTASLTLYLMSKGYTEERRAKRMGNSGKWKHLMFTGADLTNATDVRYIHETGLGDSRAQRMAAVSDLTEQGYLDPMDPAQKAMAFKLMGASALEELTAQLNVDIEEAEQEIFAITHPEVGGQVYLLAEPHQNHEVHYERKNNFRKTEEYRELVTKHPDIALAFELNLEGDPQKGIPGHSTFIEMARQQAMEEQMAMQSTPAPKGVASQPSRPMSGDQLTAAKQAGGMTSA